MKKLTLVSLVIPLFFVLISSTACHFGKKGNLTMKITMAVSEKVMMLDLAGNAKDSSFIAALDMAGKMKQTNSNGDYFELFEKAWKQINPNGRLAAVFLVGLRERINYNSTDQEVITAIRSVSDEAIDISIDILKSRLERYGLDDYKIDKQPVFGRISLEIKGVDNATRVRKLLSNGGLLEFYETYENKEIYALLDKADKTLGSGGSSDTVTENTPEDMPTNEMPDMQQYAKEHPLWALLAPSVVPDEKGLYNPATGPVAGYSKASDISKVNTLLGQTIVRNMLPMNLRFAWTINPIDKTSSQFALLALKVTRDGEAILNSDYITDASEEKGQNGNSEISISMNSEGAKLWKRITADNIGRSIAIVLDGKVYSYPTVQAEITGGRSTITGNFTKNEAEDLASILKSGRLPIDFSIIEEIITSEK